MRRDQELISQTYIVHVLGGLHARPSGQIVQYVTGHELDAWLMYGDVIIQIDSVLDIMSLCIPCGASITVLMYEKDQEHFNNIKCIFYS